MHCVLILLLLFILSFHKVKYKKQEIVILNDSQPLQCLQYPTGKKKKSENVAESGSP